MSRIVSSIPGRIRVRDNKLRNQTTLDRLKTELSNITAIPTLEGNNRTGSSLLVWFNKNVVTMSCIEAQVESAVDRVIGKSSSQQRLLSKKNLNRYNKMAMLLFLGTSLYTLTLAGRKRRIRWHRLTGYLFVANPGVHLFTYRKSLFRLFR
jgi:hypothetical protein